MKPNRNIIFPLDNVADLAQVMTIPRGELFHVGMNRWNGNVILTYQDHPEARFFIRLIVGQLANVVDMFDEESYCEPNSGLIDIEEEGQRRVLYGSCDAPAFCRFSRDLAEVV